MIELGFRRVQRLASICPFDAASVGNYRRSNANMIPFVPSITRFARVPVPHTNDATYALDAAGNEWVAKREAEMGCEALLAEAISWLLARQIGVRAPDAAFCDADSERAWLSRRVPDANHWSAAIASRIANAGEAGAIIALDAIVFNEARHGRNLLATAMGPEAPYAVWAIDADEARIGHVDEYASLGTAVPDPRIHAAGFPASILLPHALAAAQLATAVRMETLRAMVESACLVAREPRKAALLDALAGRCARAESLTREYATLLECRQ